MEETSNTLFLKHVRVGVFANPLIKYFSHCKQINKIYVEIEKT